MYSIYICLDGARWSQTTHPPVRNIRIKLHVSHETGVKSPVFLIKRRKEVDQGSSSLHN